MDRPAPSTVDPETWHQILRFAAVAWVTLPFIVAGMIAWRRRPDSRFGPLMILAGFATPLARCSGPTTLDELRDLARGIHPAVLSWHELGVALESMAVRSPVPLEMDVAEVPRLPEPVEVAAYYVVSESLANTGKHAGATSARLQVAVVDHMLVVEVADDGGGCADVDEGSGLRGLADRVEALDGQLRVWSPPGRGTRVRAVIPFNRP